MLPEVGLEGQKKISTTSVLCVGAGGLGSPVALYLAAAGIGKLGIVDFDRVELSNLQRQIIHGGSDVGRPKTQSAKTAVNRVNSNVEVVLHETRLTSQNALEIVRPYDIVVDGTDNFPTRYLVNDAAYLLKKPLIDGWSTSKITLTLPTDCTALPSPTIIKLTATVPFTGIMLGAIGLSNAITMHVQHEERWIGE
jgi:adenylyltransferase/sulfurtransferase